MSVSSIGLAALVSRADAAFALVFVAKWTVVLSLAWLAHGLLTGHNPRWRVALWRGAMVGVVLVAALSSAPPVVGYPLVPSGQASAEHRPRDWPRDPAPPSATTIPPPPAAAVRWSSIAPGGSGRLAPRSASASEPTGGTGPELSSAPPARSGGDDDRFAGSLWEGRAQAEVHDAGWARRLSPRLLSLWVAGVPGWTQVSSSPRSGLERATLEVALGASTPTGTASPGSRRNGWLGVRTILS